MPNKVASLLLDHNKKEERNKETKQKLATHCSNITWGDMHSDLAQLVLPSDKYYIQDKQIINKTTNQIMNKNAFYIC